MRKLNHPYKQPYQQQKDAAKRRGIEWHFTYETWVEWWGDDIINRGRRTGQLVMARHNDTGPYSLDNVRKAPCGDNTREGNLGKVRGPRSDETKLKISIRLTGNKNGVGNPGNTTKGRPKLKGQTPWNKGLSKLKKEQK